MGLIKNIFAIILAVTIFLAVCHFLRIGPWCLFTDGVVAFVLSFDTSNIIPSGGIEFGAITGGLSVATAGWGMFKKKVTELSKYKKTATEDYNKLKGSFEKTTDIAGKQAQELEKQKSLIDSQVTQVSVAEDAKEVAEEKLSSIEKENEKLREQLNTLNNICSDAKVKADNLENLPIIKQVI